MHTLYLNQRYAFRAALHYKPLTHLTVRSLSHALEEIELYTHSVVQLYRRKGSLNFKDRPFKARAILSANNICKILVTVKHPYTGEYLTVAKYSFRPSDCPGLELRH